MRCGPDTALAKVVQVFGAAHPHTAYLFANKRGNRLKVLVHDGLDVRDSGTLVAMINVAPQNLEQMDTPEQKEQDLNAKSTRLA